MINQIGLQVEIGIKNKFGIYQNILYFYNLNNKDMKLSDFDLYMGGEPCILGKSRKFSFAGGRMLKEYVDEIKSSGKQITQQEFDFMTEHIYYQDQINQNIETENYEECARLLKIKNELVQEKGETITNFI